MNKIRLRAKLNNLLPADVAKFTYDTIMLSGTADNIFDVVIKDGKVRCIEMEGTPRENLKRAVLNYFDSKLPTEVTTYTQLNNLAKAAKREFDLIAMEALTDIIKDLED